MPVNCRQIMDAMEIMAPGRLAAAWDNVGLLVGDPGQAVARVLVALDVTPELAAAAAADGVDMIVAHHPLIFRPLAAIRTDRRPDAALAALLRAGIAVFAAHTNLDVAAGGVNDVLAARLGLKDLRPLTAEHTDRLCKLAVFVPQTHAEAVRTAITEAGAGHIGNYSHCTFQTAGTGTFLPLAGTSPFIGRQGQLEYTAELRLETIMPESVRDRVVAAMLQAHPYEEVAYDLYSLNNPGRQYGLGRVGETERPFAAADFALMVKTALGAEHIRLAGPRDKVIKKAAVCGGSGADLIGAAAGMGADCLVTGDVKYHEAQQALACGIVVMDAGHYFTERPVVEAVAGYLRTTAQARGWELDILTDTAGGDIFRTY